MGETQSRCHFAANYSTARMHALHSSIRIYTYSVITVCTRALACVPSPFYLSAVHSRAAKSRGVSRPVRILGTKRGVHALFPSLCRSRQHSQSALFETRHVPLGNARELTKKTELTTPLTPEANSLTNFSSECISSCREASGNTRVFDVRDIFSSFTSVERITRARRKK